MRKLLPALLVAGVVMSPASAGRRSRLLPPDRSSGMAPGEAPDATRGTEQAVNGEHGGKQRGGRACHAALPLKKPAELAWTFAGPFGHWDLGQLQRGLKVYKEVARTAIR